MVSNKKISYIAIFNDIIFNKNITDKQFCLYGYLLCLARDGVLILNKNQRAKIKKLFKYRYYIRKGKNGRKETNLTDDLNNLVQNGLMDKIKLLCNKKDKHNQENWFKVDWKISLKHVTRNSKNFTMLPRQVFTEVMPEINNFKAIRYLYFLRSFYNEQVSQKLNIISNIFPSYNTINKVITRGDKKKINKLNKLLEKYKLIKVYRPKLERQLMTKKFDPQTNKWIATNLNNVYEILIDNIVNFNSKDERKWSTRSGVNTKNNC